MNEQRPESPANEEPITEDRVREPGDPQLSLWPADASSRGPEEQGPLTPPEREPPWTLADLFAFIIFAAFSFVFSNLIAVVIFSALQREFSWKVDMTQAFTATPWVVSMQTGWEMLWLLFIYMTVSKKYLRPFWRAIKWKAFPRPGLFLTAGVALAIAAQSVFSLFPSNKHLPIEKLFSSQESSYLLAFFGICVAPFVEELVFRGFFYPVFEKLWGFLAAVLLTALLFAAIHVPQLSGGWREITAIFFVGVALSYCRGKTGSLVPPFLMHLAYNISLFASLYISTDHFRTIKG